MPRFVTQNNGQAEQNIAYHEDLLAQPDTIPTRNVGRHNRRPPLDTAYLSKCTTWIHR